MKMLLLAAVGALSLTGAAHAATLSIGTDEGLVNEGRDNQGWWASSVRNTNPTNDNYFTGVARGKEYRSYFTFDLPDLIGETVTGATLELRRYKQKFYPTLELFDVSASATDLAQRDLFSREIFDDLGSGTSYGSFTPGSGASTDVLSFDLNADALSDIMASLGGYFSFGAKVGGGVMFSFSDGEPGHGGPGYTQQLVLTTTPSAIAPPAPVPLPAPLAMLVAGLGALGLARRKRA